MNPHALDAIRKAWRTERYCYFQHALMRRIQRKISHEEILRRGEIIEDYPDDKYSPSCLLCGLISSGRMLHCQASYPDTVVIITCYEPAPDEWIDGKTRRKVT